jgi:hypothetical protein
MKEKSTAGFPFFGSFLPTASVRRRRMSMYVFYSQVLYQRISVNYASEFRNIFEANDEGVPPFCKDREAEVLTEMFVNVYPRYTVLTALKKR